MADGDGVICFNEFVPLFEGHPVEPIGPRTTWRSRPGGCSTPCGGLTAPTCSHIWAQCPEAAGIGLAVANRLNKAAGFHIVQAE